MSEANEQNSHPTGVVCTMSDKVDLLHSEVSYIKNQQSLLNEKVDMKFEILTDFFRESLERQDKSIDRIAVVAEEARRSNDLLSQDIEFRFKEREQKEIYQNQLQEKDTEIKKLTAKQKFIILWSEPLGKVFVTVSTAFGLLAVGFVADMLGLDASQFIK